MRRFAVRLIMFVIAFCTIERFCHQRTQGFSQRKIRSELPFHSEWTIAPLSDAKMEKIHTILSQPYYFLNSGGECYVFGSKDGKYVLKFFKHHHMKTKSWMDPLLPQSFINRRMQKLTLLFTSCKLSYDRFRKETGLVYVHLNKTHDLKIKLSLFDPIGVIHKINLDQFEFALQKKASLAYPTIGALKEAQELDAAKVRIASLVNLIAHRCEVGLADHDARRRNFGFLGEQAIEIDLGSFSVNENLKTSSEMKKVLMVETGRLRQWIHKYHPELLEFLDETVNTLLTNNE